MTTIEYYLAFPGAKKPTRSDEGSVGYDLFSPTRIFVEPDKDTIVNTGVILRMNYSDPNNSYYAEIKSKSSVAWYKKLVIDAGVLDPGYRGTIYVIFRNVGEKTVVFEAGDPIAQIVFHKVQLPTLVETQYIPTEETERGIRSFGGQIPGTVSRTLRHFWHKARFSNKRIEKSAEDRIPLV